MKKIRGRLAAPYPAGRSAIKISASIDMAIYPIDGCTLGDVIQASDRAMYRDKDRELALRNLLEHTPRKQALCAS